MDEIKQKLNINITKKKALQMIGGISVVGVLFSGYLSFSEIFAQTCALGTCAQKVVGVPTCLIGFIMYLLILSIVILSLRSEN